MAPKDDSGFSRRDFIKSTGVGGLAAGLVGQVELRARQGVREVGPGAVPIQLTINGRRHELSVEPRVTLLDAVRNRLEITGVKRVCDRGTCGACTMIVDGRTVYACSILAIEAAGRDIRTVESLGTEAALHPVEASFCEHDALMCGFCTPGFVMATTALLEREPNPSPDAVRHALDGNICRCGTYKKVIEAALATRGVRRG
jgi:aerobic-type carbon monoxide dehydrogenase small subunit (CoxS/CutS family)